jgi:hypothetical protein
MNFRQWYDKKLKVGGYPFKVEEDFDPSGFSTIINVSDEWHPDIYYRLKQTGMDCHWFAMNERKKDAGVNSIFSAMCILYECERNQRKTYLHCHAGANRSRAVEAAYYFMRTGSHLKQQTGTFMNRLLAMCARGYLPPKAEMEKFLTMLGNNLKKNELTGGSLEEIKISSLNNF